MCDLLEFPDILEDGYSPGKSKVKFMIYIQMMKTLSSEVLNEELSLMRNLIKLLKGMNNKLMTRMNNKLMTRLKEM